VLATLPAADFPVIDELAQQQSLKIAQADLRRLLDKTHFSMAQQDVRYYLNGMLLETDGKMLRTVATDGHRLALCEMDLPSKSGSQQVIVPRKGVLELQRLLGTEGDVQITIGSNHIRAQIGDVRFTSKLIDGRFPEYSRVIPSAPAEVGSRRSRGAPLGSTEDVDPCEREVPRDPACAQKGPDDAPGTQPGAGRGRRAGRSHVQGR
jgi:DNA polymerase III beta subunit